ncbi:CheD3 [Desulforapulum autotrophicum HRM2]|uniref:Probable chemoreceptor glutamine deamidase CheD n=1 Tax=Desulforapulum autotrophicum (strain ATCC 43914 / DSM 3382 / VKM B-1955 / HRM2) TaxID=177437 RepID=C0Q9T6_DESAH|nr:HDOD domain-containing protein [Desulforapulum autotrophicum]ACN16654.1 CheD3 [Desulforapulum autotrophicum HRM2]
MVWLRREHIPAGSFRVEKKGQILLQAFLGTCVGVALYDKVTKIGGLIHILLPEPPSTMPPEYPEKYASTGLPLLLEELFALGVDPCNLTATIAGGALVAPLSELDIHLDIGGRSTDIAIDILNRSGIKIVKSETGGFFTCTLELNMATGQFAIKPVALETPVNEHTVSLPPLSEQDITKTIKNLKPIPQTALKILRMIQDDHHNMKEITRELGKDQVLGARVLKITNSAMFFGRIKIESIQDAVLLLGESLLLKMIITAVLKDYFNQVGDSGYSLCRGGLFFHAVGCAMVAEKIAELTGREPPNTAYTAGLLHDIGKVVLDQQIAAVYPLFFRGIHHDGTSAVILEQKILGTTHCITGALLARQWNFSPALIEAISFHHTPEQATDHRNLVGIVHLSDLLMSRFNVGLELERMEPTSLLPTIDHLGLTLSDLPGIIDSIFPASFDKKGQLSFKTRTLT